MRLHPSHSTLRGQSEPGRPRRIDDAYELSLGAARIVALYLVLGAVWILFSDILIAAFVTNPDAASLLQSIKGVAFVAFTAALLWFLVNRDINTLRAAEWQLTTANNRLDELADFPRLSPFPIVQLDSAGRVEFANAAADSAASQLGLNSAADLLPGDFVDRGVRALRTGEPVSGVEAQVNGNHFEWSFFPVTRRGRVYAFADDVTLQRQFQTRLVQSEKLDVVARLSAGLAHDFGNQVAAIKTQLSFILEDLPGDHELREDLEMIERNADRATGMVRHMMRMGREDYPSVTVFDLREEVRAMSPLLRHLLPRGVTLEVNNAGGPLPVSLDSSQLGRVLTNLVVNAGDAIENAGTVTIDVQPIAGTDCARLSVSDTGPGMSAQALEHLWEPFFTTKGPGGGTGLGLATVKQIIEASGGTIDVIAEPGRGPRFQMDIPLALDG